MRILLVQDTDWIKRGPHQQHHVFERLALKGDEIRVIDYPLLWREEKGGLISKRQVLDGAPKVCREAKITVVRPAIIRLPFLDMASLLFIHRREIERQIEEYKPDVIIGQTILNTYLAFRAAKRHNIPFVLHVIDALNTLVPYRVGRPVAKAIEKRLLKGADEVIVINDRLKDYAVSMGATANRTHVVTAGVDLERFQPNSNREAVRQEFGFADDDLVLFFMGWLYTFSGLKEVALALAKEPLESKIKLLVVGEGDLYPELVQIRDTHGLADRLVLAGKQPYERIPELIAAADICLLPAHNNEIMKDIVPIKLYEYLAGARPVIATALAGLMREFGEGNGVVYVEGPHEVLEAVREIDGQRLADEGRRARAFVETRSWSSRVDEFQAVLEQVTGQSSKNTEEQSAVKLSGKG